MDKKKKLKNTDRFAWKEDELVSLDLKNMPKVSKVKSKPQKRGRK